MTTNMQARLHIGRETPLNAASPTTRRPRISRKSHYIFDLDQMTVTRHRGANASATINDQTRPIDTIVACEVGRGGLWTMKPEGNMAVIVEDF